MKIICQKNTLYNGINIVSKAVSSKTTMEILKCILIETDGDRIKLTANDTELGIETYIEGETIEPGKIALEAKIFFDIVKKVPDYDMVIETKENGQTFITCEQIHFTIRGLAGDDFTRLPEIDKEQEIVLSQYDLKDMIHRTSFSISNNENNKLMTGELIRISGDSMTMTALDGHRISIRKTNLQESYPDIEVIIPGKTLSEINKIIPGEAKDMISLYFNQNFVLFEYDQTRVVSRLLDGKFYNISHMLSTDYEVKITINKMDFIRCLDRSTLFVKENERKPIILKTNKDRLDVFIRSDMGGMEDSIPILKEGKDLTIGLNPRFMVDALRAIDDEEVTMYFINSVAPCVIKNEMETYFYLVLPINVGNSDY